MAEEDEEIGERSTRTTEFQVQENECYKPVVGGGVDNSATSTTKASRKKICFALLAFAVVALMALTLSFIVVIYFVHSLRTEVPKLQKSLQSKRNLSTLKSSSEESSNLVSLLKQLVESQQCNLGTFQESVDATLLSVISNAEAKLST